MGNLHVLENLKLAHSLYEKNGPYNKGNMTTDRAYSVVKILKVDGIYFRAYIRDDDYLVVRPIGMNIETEERPYYITNYALPEDFSVKILSCVKMVEGKAPRNLSDTGPWARGAVHAYRLENDDRRTFSSREAPDVDSKILGHGSSCSVTYQVTYQNVSKTYTVEVLPNLIGTVTKVTEKGYEVTFPEYFGGGEIFLPWTGEKYLLNEPFPRSVYSYYEARLVHEVQYLNIHKAVSKNCEFQDEETKLNWKSFAWGTILISAQNDLKGLQKRKAVFDAVKNHDLLAYTFLAYLPSSKTENRICRNKLLGSFFDATKDDPAEISKEIRKAVQNVDLLDAWSSNIGSYLNDIASSLPGAADKLEEEAQKKDWTKRKDMGSRADGLGITSENFPLLRAAIEAGEIPTGVFNHPGDQGPVNREFPVWEEALSKAGWASEIYSVAQNAAGRSTYQRDVTPWLVFMLYTLPEYLNKYSPLPKVTVKGKKVQPSWVCMPKHVSSSWELEMAEASENGTVKRRSALTPVADNEKGVVTVPYVAMSIGGDRTQWCYSRHYYLFQKGFTDPESGGMVFKDFEEKLNGKDDYGLMYYDLNGTVTAQGYPTFLIIFERRNSGTHVHFHRVRPCRSKDGVKTPACELIGACYQYMAGNVPASDIVAQQGDIMLLKYTGEGDPLSNGSKVASEPESGKTLTFESHKFVGPLKLYRSEAKTPKNRLGFIHAPEGLTIEHPEHDNVVGLAGGWYEVRRAVSWEANPVSIWSRSID